MARITRFEDIEAWQRGRELTQGVYRATAQQAFSRDLSLRDQMRRAAVSVLSNIAEGFERGGDREFRQFLSLAKGSTGELRAQLYVALDAGYLPDQQFRELYRQAAEVARMITGLMRYLGVSDLKGTKYKNDRTPHP